MRTGLPVMLRLSEIYECHHRRVRAIASRYVAKHDIDDVTQIVFLKVLKALPEYEEQGKLEHWISRIARTTALDYKDQYWLTKVDHLELSPEVATPFDSVSDYDRHEVVTEALLELAASQREVLFLRYVVGLLPAEIALRMGKTKGAVSLLLHRASRNMQIKLTEKEAA